MVGEGRVGLAVGPHALAGSLFRLLAEKREPEGNREPPELTISSRNVSRAIDTTEVT
jgi:hypothetical protein